MPVKPRMVAPPAPPRSDRVPPHSVEAERGLLGSLLLESGLVLDLCVARGLSEDAFYVPAHQVLYRETVDMHRQHRPVDLLTVVSWLKERELLEEIGGGRFVEQLVESTPTAAHAEWYLQLVQQKEVLRKIIDKSREAIESCYGPVDDANEILNQVETSILGIKDDHAVDAKPWDDLVHETMEHIETMLRNKGGPSGLSTGFRGLDETLMGMQNGDMIILAARPSMGKTSLAMNIVENVATGYNVTTSYGDKQPRAVAVFSLEMSRESLVRRMICSRARVSWRVLTKGYVPTQGHGELMRAADALTKARIYLDDTAGLSAVELVSRARRMKKRFGIELIVIDYLQMLHYPERSREGRQIETASISNALKAMAKELHVPVIVLSQLSRAPEERGRGGIPKLSDLRDSGSIEQDADVVMLLRRPCRIKEDDRHDDKTLAIVDVAKQRNGPTGIVELNFDDEFTRFEDRARHGTDDGFVGPTDGGFEE